MKTCGIWFVVNGLLVGIILAYALPTTGQTLQPVATGGGISLWMVVAVGVAAVVIAGLIIWHKRNPSGQAAAMAEAHADLAKVLGQLHDLFDRWSSPKIDSPLAAPPPPPGPTPEQIAAIQQAEAALAKAKSEAGLP